MRNFSREVSDRTTAIQILDAMMGGKIFSHRILDFDESKKLSNVIHGIGNNDSLYISVEDARELFVSSNFKLVRQICLNYRRSYPEIDIEDLFQMGVLGLLKAVEKWDPEREFMFSTYATWWIRQTITRNAMDLKSLIRIPVHMLEKIPKVQQYLDNYQEFFGFNPSTSEATDSLLLSEREYKEILDSVYSYVRMGDYLNREGELTTRIFNHSHLDSTLVEPFDQVFHVFLSQALNQVLDTLSSRESTIIRYRFGLFDGNPKTLDEIGTLFSLTRERIRQIEVKAMKKLRHPSRSDYLADFLVDINFDVEDLPHEIKVPNFIVGREPQD